MSGQTLPLVMTLKYCEREEMMRILLAHKYFHLTGGAEVFFFEVGHALEERGHEVVYFSTESEENVKSKFSEYFVSPPQYDSGCMLRRAANIGRVIYSFNAKKKFEKLLRDTKPDLVHVFAIHVHLTPSILVACKEFGVPVVMSCNDYKHICPNYKLYHHHKICTDCSGGRFYKAIINKCCKDSLAFSVASCMEAYIHSVMNIYTECVQRYLFASEFMLNKTKEFWHNKSIEYGVLKNPFDASQYKPVFQGDYALYFGRIIDEKGVDLIVEAAKRVSVPVKIVGDGPDLARLRAEVEKQRLSHVEFLGAMWGDELNQVLYGARFVIVPSLWHENFPYVIFQAFAAGKPVIGSLRGGIPELIGNERGLLFDPDYVDELAEGMKRLWLDVDGCRRMGQLAREYVLREFSDDVFYDSLMSNYQAVLK